jgi:hypothetical protein
VLRGKTGKLGAELRDIDEIRQPGPGPASNFCGARHEGRDSGKTSSPEYPIAANSSCILAK